MASSVHSTIWYDPHANIFWNEDDYNYNNNKKKNTFLLLLFFLIGLAMPIQSLSGLLACSDVHYYYYSMLKNFCCVGFTNAIKNLKQEIRSKPSNGCFWKKAMHDHFALGKNSLLMAKHKTPKNQQAWNLFIIAWKFSNVWSDDQCSSFIQIC